MSDSTSGFGSGLSTDLLETDHLDELSRDEAQEQPVFTEAQLTELIETYKLFIKKKQPNSVYILCNFYIVTRFINTS